MFELLFVLCFVYDVVVVGVDVLSLWWIGSGCCVVE